jgi:hypothetical protein
MREHQGIIEGALLGGVVAAWVSAASIVGTNPAQHFTSPVVLGLSVAGATCLIAALVLFGISSPLRRAVRKVRVLSWYAWRYVRLKPPVMPSDDEIVEMVAALGRLADEIDGPVGRVTTGGKSGDASAGQTRHGAQKRREATLIRFMDQGEGYRERITRDLYPSPPTLIGNPVTWPILYALLTKWLSELHGYALHDLSDDFVKRIPSLPPGATSKDGLVAIDATISLIEEAVGVMS